MVLAEARARGIEIVVVAIEGEADRELDSMDVVGLHWITIGQLSKCVRIFRDAGISKALMAGRVRHVNVFQILKPDPLTLKVLSRLSTRSTDEMLREVATVLEEKGVTLVDSTSLLTSFLAEAGPMTARRPKRGELSDLRFGLTRARGLAALDIGQTVVVKRGAVVSAEAMEGSDAAIRRAPSVVSGPFAVVKVARPAQDFRFDVPVVGPTTIHTMDEAGASVLGVETGRVLLLDKDELLADADRRGIAVYGIGGEEDDG